MFQSKDYIYEIYRCGSFSAAARNLYITQPAISIAVKKEEQELGQPIFERSSSHLLLLTQAAPTSMPWRNSTASKMI